MQLEPLIAQYGLLALFLGAGIEGETVVLLGGAFAHRGSFSPVAAVAAAATGSFIADQLFFLIGRRFREHRWVVKVRQRPVYARAAKIFDKHPVAFVFGFRFVYGMRTVSPIAIGTTTLPAARFALLNAMAALLWATVFITLGYSFGAGLEAMLGRIHNVGHFALIAAGAALAVGLIAWAVHRRRVAYDDDETPSG